MDPDRAVAIQALIGRLRAASAGECAAATAYGGHWRSVRDRQQRAIIQGIQEDEREHRRQVQQMLVELGTRHSRVKDAWSWCIGFVIAVSCFFGGWLLPMAGAGRIEARNIREYEDAARKAVAAGRPDWAECFLVMAEVEWDHEKIFHDWVRGHRWMRMRSADKPGGDDGPGRLARWIDWPAPPPRRTIRASFVAREPLEAPTWGALRTAASSVRRRPAATRRSPDDP